MNPLFFQNSDDLTSTAKSIGENFPYLIVCYTAEEITYHVVIEQEPMCQLSNFKGALIHLMGAYFVYDIAYPKVLNSLLLMLQHHILGLADSQRDTPAVIEIVTSLQSMDNSAPE